MSNTGLFTPEDINELTAYGQWQGLSQRGSLELIQTQTFSSVSNLDFNSIKESTYNVHFMTLSDIEHTSTSKTLLQFFESGVIETASVYQYAFQQGESNGNFYDTLRSTGASSIYVTYSNNGTNTGDSESSYMYFYDLGDSTKYSFVTMQSIFQDNGVFKFQFGSALLPQASVVDGIRLNFDSASTNGVASLYGIRYS
jgi:hypothetical protein